MTAGPGGGALSRPAYGSVVLTGSAAVRGAVADTPGGVAVLVARCVLAGPGLLRRPVPSAPGRGRAWRRGTSCWAPSGPAAARRPGSAGADRALLRRAERAPLAGRLHPFGSAGADRRDRPRRPRWSPGCTWSRWRAGRSASGDECRCLWHRQRCGPLRGPWQCRRFASRCGAPRRTGWSAALDRSAVHASRGVFVAPRRRRRAPPLRGGGARCAGRPDPSASPGSTWSWWRRRTASGGGPYSQGGGGSVVCGPVGGWGVGRPGAPLGRLVTRRATRNPAGPPGRAASRSLREPGTPAGTRVRASLPDRPRGAPAHRAEPWRTPPGEAAAGGTETAPDLRKHVIQVTPRDPCFRWTRTPK
ncbi:hypothetical protein SALBM311S_10401 [Streptomyces alboniger]